MELTSRTTGTSEVSTASAARSDVRRATPPFLSSSSRMSTIVCRVRSLRSKLWSRTRTIPEYEETNGSTV